MELNQFITVKGDRNVCKVLKIGERSIIAQTLDKEKRKFIIQTKEVMALLSDITVFTTDEKEFIKLGDLFQRIFEKHGKEIAVNFDTPYEELQKFLLEILPEYNQEKVHHSDIKKIVHWYTQLQNLEKQVNFVSKEEEKKKDKKEEKKEVKSEEKKEVKTEKPESPKKSPKK